MKKDRTLSLARKIANPCVQICVRDRDDDVCLGCGRTSAEINNWARMSRDEREEIVTQLDERLEDLTSKRRKSRRGRRGRQMAGETL